MHVYVLIFSESGCIALAAGHRVDVSCLSKVKLNFRCCRQVAVSPDRRLVITCDVEARPWNQRARRKVSNSEKLMT